MNNSKKKTEKKGKETKPPPTLGALVPSLAF
jgi:hypothetical protein